MRTFVLLRARWCVTSEPRFHPPRHVPGPGRPEPRWPAVRSELGRYKTTPDYRRFRHNERHLANASFALGMVASIAEKLTAMKASRDQVNQSTGRGLVVLKASIVDDEFGKLGLNLRAARSTGRTVSMTAYEAGGVAGSSLAINPAVGEPTT